MQWQSRRNGIKIFWGGSMHSLKTIRLVLLYLFVCGAREIVYAAQHDTQNIHKRLAAALEEEIKEAGEEVPLLEIRIEEPEESKQRPVKTSMIQNVKNYLALHGQAAQQRLRKLKYPAIGMITDATVATLFALPNFYFFTDILKPNFPAQDFCPAGMERCTPCPEGMIEGEVYCEGERWKNILAPLIAAGPATGLALHSASRNYAYSQARQAIIAGDIQRIKNIFATRLLNVNYTGPSDEQVTLLMVAAQHGQAEIAKFLLEQGADVSLKNAQERDALDYTQFTTAKDPLSGKTVITDSEALQNGKLAVRGVILEQRLKKREQARLRGLYEPTEVLAAAAIEALHISMYGRSGLGAAEDISTIVGSYLTPAYVHIPRTR